MHHAHIDKYAFSSSPIHSLDARCKFLTVAAFTVAMLAVPRHSVILAACLLVWPLAVLAIAKIPLKFALRHTLFSSVFILVLALTCPWYDRTAADVNFGPWSFQTTGGWLRAAVILLKFAGTMLALIALVSTTRFSDLLAALRMLKLPQVLVMQLGFLYRYIFLVIDRAHRLLRAKNSRGGLELALPAQLRVTGSIVASLFVRSLDNAERINRAMQCRGFNGNWHSLSEFRTSPADFIFPLTMLAYVATVFLFFFLSPL